MVGIKSVCRNIALDCERVVFKIIDRALEPFFIFSLVINEASSQLSNDISGFVIIR